MELGYATGYVSHIMGKFVLHVETECNANGCTYAGKTLEAWGDIEHELKYYQADPIAEQIVQLQNQVEGLRQSLSEEINYADLVGVSRGFKAAWDLESVDNHASHMTAAVIATKEAKRSASLS